MIRTFCTLALAAAATAGYIVPEESCWTETRKCRWEAKQDGYKCIDYYEGHYARCHPIMKYKKVCDAAVTEPRQVPKAPAEYTEWEMTNSTLVGYSKDYGTHVKGYPADGASKYYDTDKLPKHPKGFPAKPSPAPSKPYVPRTDPTTVPTAKPYKATAKPTTAPTAAPYKPTAKPTVAPTAMPYKPTSKPTVAPTAMPYEPTSKPTVAPTAMPYKPTEKPTIAPTAAPYKDMTKPTTAPTAMPYKPTATPKPYKPTAKPTVAATAVPKAMTGYSMDRRPAPTNANYY